MKVFISWSGSTSHRVAVVLRDWLPSVIQSIEPYVSSEDIDKGARWSSDIAGELHASTYGLICLTKDNISAPWINFEAGALGKSIDKSRVSPFLFRIKRSEVEGPILQFQSTVFDREDVLKLLKSINSACGAEGLEDSRLDKSFDVWWPQLEKQLNEIPSESDSSETNRPDTSGSVSEEVSRVLEEILELTRVNHKILRSPEGLLPVEYFQHIISRVSAHDDSVLRMRNYEASIDPDAVREVIERYRDILKFYANIKPELNRNPAFDELMSRIQRLDDPLRYIARRIGLRLPRDPLIDKDEY